MKTLYNKIHIFPIQGVDVHENDINPIDVLDSLTGTVEGPVDWAVNHDKYLYRNFDNADTHDGQ